MEMPTIEIPIVIAPYHELSKEVRKGEGVEIKEKNHSNYFWHKCAEEWHRDDVHRVYGLFDGHDKNMLFGFFSIRVGDFKFSSDDISKKDPNLGAVQDDRDIHYPILDISFMGVNEKFNLTDESFGSMFKSILEYAEEIARKVSKQVACRYLRCYNPLNQKRELIHSFLPGILEERGFDIKIKKKEELRKLLMEIKEVKVLEHF